MPASDDAHWSSLMQRAQAGDRLAYERLLTELGVAIAGYLRHRFGAVDFAEDCVQECLIAIHEARHSFEPGRPFRPWLFAIVRHRAIDMLRRQRTHAAVFAAGVMPDDVPAADAAADPERRDRRLAMGAVLAALEPEHREALQLTRLMGFSTAEAASRLGISETALRVRVHRATRAAIRLLEAEPE